MIRIHCTGNWTEEQVTSREVASSRRSTPELDQRIERAWQEALARPGMMRLFDGPMCRLESWAATHDRLDLSLSPTSYRDFLGTHLSGGAPAIDRAMRANALGASAALVTSDGYLVMGRRSRRVAYYPDRVHPFAGTVEPADAGKPFDAIRRELQEELQFPASDLSEIRCIGLVEDDSICQPELVFLVRTARSKAQIETGMDPQEHVGLVAHPLDSVSSIDPSALTPVAQGTVELLARHERGITVVPGRPDTPDAMALIAALEAELEPLYPSKSRHGFSVERLIAEGVSFFVIRVHGQPAGCGGVLLLNGEFAELKRMFIRKDFRGGGLARMLLETLEAHAWHLGAPLLRLETGIHQHAAIAMYERAGFKPIGPFAGYQEDPLSRFYEKPVG